MKLPRRIYIDITLASYFFAKGFPRLGTLTFRAGEVIDKFLKNLT